MASRHMVKGKVLKEHTKELEPLKVGDVMSVQNQTGYYDGVVPTQLQGNQTDKAKCPKGVPLRCSEHV